MAIDRRLACRGNCRHQQIARPGGAGVRAAAAETHGTRRGNLAGVLLRLHGISGGPCHRSQAAEQARRNYPEVAPKNPADKLNQGETDKLSIAVQNMKVDDVQQDASVQRTSSSSTAGRRG